MTPQEIDENLIELQLAGAVQDALLSADIPKCRCGKVVLRNQMSQQVGGDFYHVRPLGPDQLVFAIGDVVGHGMGPALIMTLILGHLRTDTHHTRRPTAKLAEINDLLLSLGKRIEHFITCSLIYGIVDLPSGIVIYVNAGHPHPILCHRNSAALSFLSPTTMLLGVQPGPVTESCHQFRQYDRLVLYTDGIPEAQNPDGEFFGAERLQAIVKNASNQPPEVLADTIFAELHDFSQLDQPQDDQTLAIVDFDQVQSDL